MKILKPVYFLPAWMTFILIVSSNCSKEKTDNKEKLSIDLISEVSPDSLEAHVQWLEGMGTRFALAQNHRQVARSLKNKFIHFGYTDSELDSFQISRTYNGMAYTQWQYNVVARLVGTINPDSICIIGGHYDNILRAGTGDPFVTAFGANDNASGTAATLEIARAMKKINYQPRNTILFIAFGAEELGLLGSYAWTNNAALSGVKIRMMLNNDMIAYEPSTDKTKWVVNILDYENSHDLRLKAESLMKRYTILNNTNINTYNKQSDSYPFSLKGYPAIFFFSSATDPNYHTPSDVSGQCNFDYCAEVLKISCALMIDANTSN